MTINSKELYRSIEEAFEEARAKLGVKDVRLVIWAGYFDKINIDLSIGYGDEMKVRGVHLGDITEELQRRLAFSQQQAGMLLGAPVIEAGNE